MDCFFLIEYLDVCVYMKLHVIIIVLHLYFSHPRFLTPQELTLLINYLQDKRDRLVRGEADPHLGKLVLSDFGDTLTIHFIR